MSEMPDYNPMRVSKQLWKQFIEMIPPDDFDIFVVNDRSLLVKPKKTDRDAWMKIVIKTTGMDYNPLQVNVRLVNSVILCMCQDTKKMWLFSYKDVQDDINVDLYDISYNRYIVLPYLVGDTLTDLYKKANHVSIGKNIASMF